MKNVTISADDDLLAWLRVEAARAGKSVSRYVADILAQKRAESDRFDQAAQAGLVPARRARPLTQSEAFALWTKIAPQDWSDAKGQLPTREELYRDREDGLLRRHQHPDLQRGFAESDQEGYEPPVAGVPRRPE